MKFSLKQFDPTVAKVDSIILTTIQPQIYLFKIDRAHSSTPPYFEFIMADEFSNKDQINQIDMDMFDMIIIFTDGSAKEFTHCSISYVGVANNKIRLLIEEM